MKTVLDLGKIDYNRSGNKNCRVTIEINLENGRLSIMGNVWNPRNTDIETGGQCRDTIGEYFPHNKSVQALLAIWDRWHLNDLRAGSPAQENWLREHKHEYEKLKAKSETYVNWYDWATKASSTAKLNPDNGYKYGNAWLKEELPQEVIAKLETLIKEIA